MQSGPNQPWSHDEQAAYLDENPDSPIGKLYGLVIPSLAPIEITRRAERITGFLSRQELPPPNLGIEELEAYIQAEILDLLAKL